MNSEELPLFWMFPGCDRNSDLSTDEVVCLMIGYSSSAAQDVTLSSLHQLQQEPSLFRG